MIGPAARERVAISPGAAFQTLAVAFLIFAAALIVLELPALAISTSITGTTPPAGHPLRELIDIVTYGLVGWYAWRRLRGAGRATAIRRFTRRDLAVFARGAGAVAALPAGFVALLALLARGDHVQAGFEHFSVAMHDPVATAAAVTLTLVGGAGVDPLVEEVVFRGVLFGGLAGRLGVLPAALLSSAVFGAVHGDPLAFIPIAVGGLICALAYAATGNLLVAVALHALNNLIGLGAAVIVSLAHLA